MSAIELMEQLGANAALQRQDIASVAARHALAKQLVESDYSTPHKQWCMLIPAEEEPSEDEDEKEDKDNTASNASLN